MGNQLESRLTVNLEWTSSCKTKNAEHKLSPTELDGGGTIECLPPPSLCISLLVERCGSHSLATFAEERAMAAAARRSLIETSRLSVLDFRITTSQKWEAVPRRARISGLRTCV